MSIDLQLRQTPLYQEHQKKKAKLVPFGGWVLPLDYGSILSEYQQTRNNVSVFDVCHMGEFIIRGNPLQNGFEAVVTQSLADMPLGTCRYGMMLNERGGVIDDLIVFRIEKERWMAVVNAGTVQKDARHLRVHISPEGAWEDISSRTGKLDLQGPGARDMLSALVPDIGRLSYYECAEFLLLQEKAIISRTGYTGELGYEIYFPWEKVPALWQELLKLGALPAGLGARDLLRIEMGYSLYGHEIDEEITPWEAGLDRFVSWDKGFIGKKALLQAKQSGVARKGICFVSSSRRSPRPGQKLFSGTGERVGQVTSGTFSPHVNRGIGLGFIRPEFAGLGVELYFGDENWKESATIVKKPVYAQGTLKK